MEAALRHIAQVEKKGVVPDKDLGQLFVSVGFRPTDELISALVKVLHECGGQALTRGVLLLFIALQQQHYLRPPRSPAPGRRPLTVVDPKNRVFLGGSCNPTTWRKDVVIPALAAHRITFFNPQVDDWSPELIDLEAAAKEAAELLFFVIDDQTRGIASLVEVASYAACHRNMIVVIKHFQSDATIDGVHVSERERDDLNRGRAFLAELLYRCHVPLFEDLDDAIKLSVSLLSKKPDPSVTALRLQSLTPLIAHSAYLPVIGALFHRFASIAGASSTVTKEKATSLVEFALGYPPDEPLQEPVYTFDDVCLATAATLYSNRSFATIWTPPCLKPLLPVDYSVKSQVFLGGSCGAPSWRPDAMTVLSRNKITFFNPEIENWSPALIVFENAAKHECDVLLYVIADRSRAVGSMVEVAGFIAEGRPVVLMIKDMAADLSIDGVALSSREVKDLNRGRAYLADAARRHGVNICPTLDEAVAAAIALAASSH